MTWDIDADEKNGKSDVNPSWELMMFHLSGCAAFQPYFSLFFYHRGSLSKSHNNQSLWKKNHSVSPTPPPGESRQNPSHFFGIFPKNKPLFFLDFVAKVKYFK